MNRRTKRLLVLIAVLFPLILAMILMTLLAIKLTHMPSDSSSANAGLFNSLKGDNSDYCAQNNLEILPLESVTSKGILYYPFNPEHYNFTENCEIEFGEILEKASETPGYTQLTIPLTIKMNALYTSDCIDYSGAITPSIEFADKQTGQIFPSRNLVGDDYYKFSGQILDKENNQVSLNYSATSSYSIGEYVSSGDGQSQANLIFNVTYLIETSASTDNLLLKITPVSTYFEEITNASNEIRYILDDYTEGTLLLSLQVK